MSPDLANKQGTKQTYYAAPGLLYSVFNIQLFCIDILFTWEQETVELVFDSLYLGIAHQPTNM